MCSTVFDGIKGLRFEHPAQFLLRVLSALPKSYKMHCVFVKVTVLVIIALMVASWLSVTEATYRKPPFNGSIFGKRGITQEYDNAGKTLSTLCEIANEACQTWFPSQDK